MAGVLYLGVYKTPVLHGKQSAPELRGACFGLLLLVQGRCLVALWFLAAAGCFLAASAFRGTDG